jgi:arginine N-succinyltransferase
VVRCLPVFRIRQSYRDDVDQVLAVAEHLDTVNLPANRKHIEAILERSERSFSGELPETEREFLFVLEDLAKKRIIGTSMIYAQHGTKRAPHIFFRVENDERYSVTLDKHMVHQTLRIGYNYNGPTEIGGLILLPEYRRSAEGLGKALSYVRFLFIRMHRGLFRDQVLSELLPPLEPDGASKLWEALGRKFTGLTYMEADLISKDNKEFIHALFPDDPIHTELLPDDVRAVIGQVGPETKAVEAMLRRIGFEYAGQIDPFDGGPHFVAKTDQISLVRDAHEATVRTVDEATAKTWAVVAVEQAARPQFRAIATRIAELPGGELGITEEARARLGVEVGQRVWLAAG